MILKGYFKFKEFNICIYLTKLLIIQYYFKKLANYNNALINDISK